MKKFLSILGGVLFSSFAIASPYPSSGGNVTGAASSVTHGLTSYADTTGKSLEAISTLQVGANNTLTGGSASDVILASTNNKNVQLLPNGSGQIYLTSKVVNQLFNAVGQTVISGVFNSDNTNAASNAAFDVISGGASGGNPYYYLSVLGSRDYSFGINNATGNLTIASGINVGQGTDFLTFDTSGNMSLTSGTLTMHNVVNMDGYQINGVADGVAANDAVNVSQIQTGVLTTTPTVAVPLTAATPVLLYTVPTGKSAQVFVVRVQGSVALTGAPTLSLGTNAATYNNILPAQPINTSVVVGNGYFLNIPGLSTIATSGQSIYALPNVTDPTGTIQVQLIVQLF